MSYNPSAGGGASWGAITGTLSSQTDLQTALDAKDAILMVAPSTDITITAGAVAHCANNYYEIADTKFLEIGDGASFEIG
jgi:hypothetical protein